MYRHWVLTTCFGSSGEIDWWRQIAAGNPMWAKHTRPSSVHPFPRKQIHLALIVKWLKKTQSSFYSRIVFLSWVSSCLYNHCVDNCSFVKLPGGAPVYYGVSSRTDSQRNAQRLFTVKFSCYPTTGAHEERLEKKNILVLRDSLSFVLRGRGGGDS